MKKLNSAKGTSQAIWIIIAVIIALVVALLLILLLQKNATSAEDQGNNIIGTSGGAANSQLCIELCNICKKQYGTGCSAKWPAMTAGTKCEMCS